MERLFGRVAVITGASAGIGSKIAEELVKAGMQVVAMARRVEIVQNQAKALSGYPGKLHPLQADVSDSAQVTKAFDWIEKKLGAIAVLINNAGILTLTAVQETDTQTIESIVKTNFLGLTLCSREALLNMQRHNVTDGHIININAVLGHVVPKADHDIHFGLYCSTKHAVTAMCKTLRNDVSRMKGFKIRITDLSPGAVDTEMVPAAYTGDRLAVEDVVRAFTFVVSSPPSVEIVQMIMNATGERL